VSGHRTPGGWLVALALAVLAARCSGRPAVEIPSPDMSGTEAPIVEGVRAAQRAVAEDPESSEAWGNLGDRYYGPGWMDEAASCYARAAELDARNFRWVYMLGQCLELDRQEEALEAFERALALDDAYAPLLVSYADVLVRLGRSDEAVPYLERAAELASGQAEPRTVLGQIALSAGRFDEARDHLEAAVALEGADGRAHRALSQACLAQGDAERSARQAEAANSVPSVVSMPDPRGLLPFEPVGSFPLVERGLVLASQGRLDEAEGAFREALEINPRFKGGHYYLGLTLAQKGDLAGAEASMREVLALAPTDQEAHSLLGEVLARQGRLEEGVTHLRQAVEANIEDTNARHALASALLAIRKDDEAETFLREVLRSYPDDRVSHASLALALESRGDAEGAMEHHREALRLAGAEIDALQQQIQTELERPLGTDVPVLERRLRSLLQETAELHYRLGKMLLERGDRAGAGERFAAALELAPGHAEARLALERVKGQ